MDGTQRRRGRPSKTDGPVVTREAIVAVALQGVRASGAKGLALREVARLLGVSLPSVQRHFATREDLWRACVDAAMAEVSTNLSPVAGIEEALRAQVERSVTRPRFTAAMTQGAEPASIAYLLDRARPLVHRGRALVEDGIRAGALRPVDPTVVVALVGLGLGSLASSRAGLRQLHGIDLDDADQARRLVDGLADILLYGLLPRS
jgi:AcrR family transcriptional regulator